MSAGLKGRGVISKITWAILKDSGWYDLAQDFSEPLIWGKGAGCAFARKFCYEQLSPSGYSPDEVEPFCVEPGKSKCAADHRGFGQCNIGLEEGTVPDEYQNFDSDFAHNVEGETRVGTDVYTDHCPYHEHNVMCTDLTRQPQLDRFGEAYTGFSRCFDYVGNWTSNVQGTTQQSSGCYPIECGVDSYTVRVSKNTYTCTSGATVAVQNALSYNIAFDGTIRCPDYDIVCAGQAACTKDCHGNGKCVSGEKDTCICYPGYHGEGCDLSFGVDYCSAVPCQAGSTCVNDVAGSFSCSCPDDKTGVLCHLSTSSCTPTSCQNNGRCEDEDGAITCVCPTGFSGDKCQDSLTACSEEENTCQNGADCFLDAEAEDGFLCACPFSYEGRYCESVKNCDIFGPLACRNNGNCIIGDHSYCQCPDNFVGDFCEIEICSENACSGNGECAEDLLAQTLVCTCNDGFTGDRCEREEGDVPSQMDQCVFLSRCEIVGGARVCNEGWSGRDCMSVDRCMEDPCDPVNTARCVSLDDRFECECYPGYEGEVCTDIVESFETEPTTDAPTTEAIVDHCEPNPCQNAAKCISNDMAYFCDCTEEYTGNNCETLRGECYKLPCKNQGECAQGQDPSDFSCTCPQLWTGPTCEEAVYPCELLECTNGGVCETLGDSATCDCPIGYGGDRCENPESHCYAEPCQNGARCDYHEEHHNFTCHCAMGYLGDTCDQEMENSCDLVSECQNGTPCSGSHDDYTCDCPQGLSGEFCEINPNDCVGNPCQRILFSRCQDKIDGYECACMPGFERKSNQCGDVNECMDSPCLNGICINLPGKYRCMCRAGWKGTNCEINRNECEDYGQQCLNGAQCVDLIADFRCDCVNKYSGQYCEIAPAPCDLEPCQNGATCSNVDETNFRCNCPSGFEGERCETNIDDCASEPCVHGACVDGVADYTCECDVAYEGNNCDVYVGQCKGAMNPCANDAECVDLPDRKFECVCPEFYTGELCDENIDDCASVPCANEGVCSDGLGTFTCSCPDQWKGDTCEEDVNECAASPCQNGAECLNEDGGFQCVCLDGYEGALCETNTDDCVDHQCINGGVCVDDIAGYNCQCSEKYTGTRCEIELQFCEPDSCLNNGTCSVVENVILCDCSETGFEGTTCETEIDECVSQNVTCLHEGTCVDEILGYRCECHCAFTGDHCEDEVDFCETQQCSDNTYMCISLVNSCNFQCQCNDGWEGTLCETNIDECAANPCIHGTCEDGIADYTCTCHEGYQGDNCDDPLDKCAVEPCLNGAGCETVVEGEERYFECTCTAQYHGDTCENKHPPCFISPCGDYGLCQIDGDNELCACDDGFEGDYCEINIDECAGDPCKNGASCKDKILDFECECQPGYGGKTCEALRDPCTDTELCQNGAECAECVGEECDNRYTCTCVPGFVGTNCETDVDECEGDPCVRGECTDLINDYECTCPLGYADKNCETDIDECAPTPCFYGQECTQDIGFYTCNCVGYSGDNCEFDIDECKTLEDTCQNGGTCRNTLGSYECDCPEMFGGAHCERVVEPCDLEPCLHMADCENLGVTEYQCSCNGGYTGDNCEHPSEVCSEENNPCIPHGTCAEEDGAAVCVCDVGFMGEYCEIELCQFETCLHDGVCTNTRAGYDCNCNLPWVGKKCEKKASVLQFNPQSKASIPLGEITEKEVRVKMGLKIKDMTTEQQVFEQATSLGQLSLKLFDSKIQLTLGETMLKLPITDRFATVSVILVRNYLELMVGNQTDVSVFSESKDVSPSGGMQFGAVPSAKRAAISSYTGCLVDIGNIDIINMAEGGGFDECSDDDNEIDDINISIEPTEEAPIPCENGGIRVGPYCQCLPGFRGDICEIAIGENCQSMGCPGGCRDTSRGPQCVCSWPNGGELCTDLIIIPSFRADSMLNFLGNQYKKGNNPEYKFDMEINPEYPRGFIVMFEGSNGFCAMYLDGNIFFDCMVSGEYISREHSHTVQIDHWSLIRVHINHNTMSISVDNNVELFDCSHIQDMNLDGGIAFGSIPNIDIAGTNLEASSIPGFFGEIQPITLNSRKAKVKDSMAMHVVAAKSRDPTEDYTSPCKGSPCGSDNTCYERMRGHGCLCERSPSGPNCAGTPELLTFLGSNSYAVVDTKYGESNEFKIRFQAEADEGILLYGASKYKEKTVPQSLFYLALKDGSVHFGLYKESDVFKTMSLELSAGSWNTVTLTLHAQKASLAVSGKNINNIVRTKYESMDLFRRNTVYVGGVRDFFGLNHLVKNFDANIPFSPFVGQISEFHLNANSLLGSLSRVVKVNADGAPPLCGISPCASGSCVGDGICECDNDLLQGDLCEESVYFVPLQVTAGYVAYHKHFDVGNSLKIEFSSPLINTEKDAVILRINTMFMEDQEKTLEFKLSDFTFADGTVNTLTFERKMNHINVINGDDVTEMEFSSETKLDKEVLIGLGDNSFTGRIFSVAVDGVELIPTHGKDLSQGSYPPCYFDPCLNGAECVETSDTDFTCDCTAGYTGTVCGELIDMCEPNPCNDTSRCFSVEGTSFLCKPCPKGYHGFDCQAKAFCELLTPCTHGELVGTCTETEESYDCECGDGKVRRDCDLSDTCAQVECQHNATCVETNDEFECECTEAWQGRYCEEPIDNCAEDSCQNGGTCVSLFDDRKYFCLCSMGYSGDQCEIILDMCQNEPCQNGGVCSTEAGMFVCDCPEPFFGHDCSSSACDAFNCNDGECGIEEGSPVCVCDAGYTGEQCGLDVDECLEETACSNGQGICLNVFGDYNCHCYPGFEGKDCEINIDDCTADSCNGNGFCMDGYDSFTCLCDALYTGEFCEEKSDRCSPDPCQNGASCFNYGIDHFCICPQGYEGVNCSINSDDCMFNRCENFARCVDELNGYSCDCEGMFSGHFCERDVDECANTPCHNGANCTNTFGGFECECPEFYAGETCEVTLGECYGNPCQNGAECYEVGMVGEGRTCRCLEGWTGDDCEIRVTECDDESCQNGGSCVVSEYGFACECKYPFSGPNCATKIIVPYLSSAQSFVAFETSIVDIAKGFEFRFRPERSGFVFHLAYDNFYLNAMSTEANTMVFTANLDGKVYTKISSASLDHEEWNKVHIKANSKAITLTVNSESDVMTLKTTQLKSILRKRHQFYIGDSTKTNSFVGCFYDLGQDLGSNGVQFEGIEYCEGGNTCIAGHLGKCGEGGQCNEIGHCDCPLGRSGQYCEKDRPSRNPSFNRDGYLLLQETDKHSYMLSLAAQGTGAVFVGYDKKGREIVSLVIDSTSIKLTGIAQETIYIKGYDGAWLDLTMTFDANENAVSVELGTGEEMMTIYEGERKLAKLYLGGSAEFSNNFRGCFTEVSVDGVEPEYAEQHNVVECAMEGCYDNACQNSVNDYNNCVSDGPRYFSCICGHNFVGDKCEVQWNRQTPRFKGNSFLKFLNPDNSTSEDLMLAIVFKITSKSGLLFSTEMSSQHADYVEIGISNGRLYLTFELGAGPAFLECPRYVDDGKWHFLHLTLRGNHAVLMVDRWASEVVSPGQRNTLNVGPYLFLGGSPTEPGITGCVESLSVRDEPLTMSDTVASSNIHYCEDNVPENSIYKLKYRLK